MILTVLAVLATFVFVAGVALVLGVVVMTVREDRKRRRAMGR